jgi:hypothetical protein
MTHQDASYPHILRQSVHQHEQESLMRSKSAHASTSWMISHIPSVYLSLNLEDRAFCMQVIKPTLLITEDILGDIWRGRLHTFDEDASHEHMLEQPRSLIHLAETTTRLEGQLGSFLASHHFEDIVYDVLDFSLKPDCPHIICSVIELNAPYSWLLLPC